MSRIIWTIAAIFFACSAAIPSSVAGEWKMSGEKQLVLHARSGMDIPIGTVIFTPQGIRTAFRVVLDRTRFKTFFLSMRDFKCIEGDDIQCHVPYPYPHPGTVGAGDFSWLEHELLFMTKTPSEFGANLYNGLYYAMTLTDIGLVGRPQSVDLNLIASPPPNADVPPFDASERQDKALDARWITTLTIEDAVTH